MRQRRGQALARQLRRVARRTARPRLVAQPSQMPQWPMAQPRLVVALSSHWPAARLPWASVELLVPMMPALGAAATLTAVAGQTDLARCPLSGSPPLPTSRRHPRSCSGSALQHLRCRRRTAGRRATTRASAPSSACPRALRPLALQRRRWYSVEPSQGPSSAAVAARPPLGPALARLGYSGLGGPAPSAESSSGCRLQRPPPPLPDKPAPAHQGCPRQSRQPSHGHHHWARAWACKRSWPLCRQRGESRCPPAWPRRGSSSPASWPGPERLLAAVSSAAWSTWGRRLSGRSCPFAAAGHLCRAEPQRPGTRQARRSGCSCAVWPACRQARLRLHRVSRLWKHLAEVIPTRRLRWQPSVCSSCLQSPPPPPSAPVQVPHAAGLIGCCSI
mmetsp:Transcript_14801/g.40504  ORF Transcript_14801/g.40504 Transcript_14801/m.40504 type:complete len:389 (+) Transcript_14801:682-1848(+)